MNQPDNKSQGVRPSHLHDQEYQTFLLWKSAHINNEWKFLAWIRTSLGLLTLGFIVERFGLFLYSTMSGKATSAAELPSFFNIITISFFVLGGIMLGVATFEFFQDRKRINHETEESTITLDILIICTLIFLAVVSIAFISFYY